MSKQRKTSQSGKIRQIQQKKICTVCGSKTRTFFRRTYTPLKAKNEKSYLANV